MRSGRFLCLMTLIVLSILSATAYGESQTASIAENQAEVRLAKYRTSDEPLERFRLLQEMFDGTVPTNPQQKSFVTQMFSTQLSELGEYERAEAIWPVRTRFPDASPPNPDRLVAEPAMDAIVRQLADQRVVMVNEAHHVARTRLLTLQLLEPLRRRGFTHLALEALWESADALAQRGHPGRDSGMYLREPVFGELVREARKLGYQIVPYEPDGDGDQTQQQRETGQAEALAKILRDDPDARILVHAGYAHIYRNFPDSLFGAQSMAMELERLTGLHALTIEQTSMLSSDERSPYIASYRIGLALWKQQARTYQPFVLRDDAGRSWSISPKVVDISVFAPPNEDAATWRALDGRRVETSVDTQACPKDALCTIAAYAEQESEDTTPADIRVVDNSRKNSLWLRGGCYRLVIASERTQPVVNRICNDSLPDNQDTSPR